MITRAAALRLLRQPHRIPRGALNLLTFHASQRLWRVHPNRLFADLDAVPLRAPIFLLGVQGGGLTVTARMLRRHPDVISVTGDHTFWAGPDEIQTRMGRFLPAELTALHYNLPLHPGLPGWEWMYATDALLPRYRKRAEDATPALAARLRRALRLILSIHARHPEQARFIDKSQTYTVRLGFVHALLQDYAPQFVLITRNPYAVCYRAAAVRTPLRHLPRPLHDRLALAAAHWTNSFRCALDDAAAGIPLHVLRFEDLLREPEARLRALCDFVGLGYTPDLLPAPHHRLPLGSTATTRGDHKWYPLRPDVNRPYLDRLEPWMADIIRHRAAPLSDGWGYTPDGP